MPQRLRHPRALLKAVLVTVMLAAALTGAMASARLSVSGLHMPYPEERIATHKGADVRAAVSARPLSSDGSTGASAVALPLVLTAPVGGTSPHAPGDWHKIASGLVPLPLRI